MNVILYFVFVKETVSFGFVHTNDPVVPSTEPPCNTAIDNGSPCSIYPASGYFEILTSFLLSTTNVAVSERLRYVKSSGRVKRAL